MAANKRQSAGRTYVSWLATAIACISALLLLAIAVFTYAKMHQGLIVYQDSYEKTDRALAQMELSSTTTPHGGEAALSSDRFRIIDTAISNQFTSIHLLVESTSYVILFLMSAVVLILILLLSQTYMWNRDRKKLELWRESGFLCERLEFLPANRLRLNNIELELNKTQIDNLIKIAKSRQQGKPIHTLDIGDHGAQSTNRLREELGKKFIEKSLIKHRKQEGYWLEVDPERIYFQPE